MFAVKLARVWRRLARGGTVAPGLRSHSVDIVERKKKKKRNCTFHLVPLGLGLKQQANGFTPDSCFILFQADFFSFLSRTVHFLCCLPDTQCTLLLPDGLSLV